MRARVEKVDVLGWNKSIVLLDFEENHTYKRTGKEAMRASIYHEQVDTEQYNTTSQCCGSWDQLQIGI